MEPWNRGDGPAEADAAVPRRGVEDQPDEVQSGVAVRSTVTTEQDKEERGGQTQVEDSDGFRSG